MLRMAAISTLLLAIPFIAARADDAKKDQAKDSKSSHATISKIDSSNHTLTITTMDEHGKEQEKTLQLSTDVKYLTAAGKDAKADSFKAGDNVCIREKDGKVAELRKDAKARISKVDRKAGTITIKMNDENGKEIERTFRLVQETEYLDSTGRIALLDVFQSGDDVLFVEADGRITSMKKSGTKQAQTGAKEDTSNKSDKK